MPAALVEAMVDYTTDVVIELPWERVVHQPAQHSESRQPPSTHSPLLTSHPSNMDIS